MIETKFYGKRDPQKWTILMKTSQRGLRCGKWNALCIVPPAFSSSFVRQETDKVSSLSPHEKLHFRLFWCHIDDKFWRKSYFAGNFNIRRIFFLSLVQCPICSSNRYSGLRSLLCWQWRFFFDDNDNGTFFLTPKAARLTASRGLKMKGGILALWQETHNELVFFAQFLFSVFSSSQVSGGCFCASPFGGIFDSKCLQPPLPASFLALWSKQPSRVPVWVSQLPTTGNSAINPKTGLMSFEHQTDEPTFLLFHLGWKTPVTWWPIHPPQTFSDSQPDYRRWGRILSTQLRAGVVMYATPDHHCMETECRW